MAALVCGARAAGQEPAPTPARWGVDYGSHYCTLFRITPPPAPSLAFQTVPGTERTRILLIGPAAGGGKAGEKAAVTLLPSARRFELFMHHEGAGKDLALVMTGAGAGFIEALGAAEEVRIERRGAEPVTVATPRAAAAVSAFGRCVDEVLASWGVDPAESLALKQRPEADGEWITAQDYPMSAIREGATGTAVVRLLVATSGRVEACDVVVSSGQPLLDRTTCRLALERARFSPAVGSDGKPVPARTIAATAWLMPS